MREEDRETMEEELRDCEHILALATHKLEKILGEMSQSKVNPTMILIGAAIPKPKGKEVMLSAQQTLAPQATIPQGLPMGKKYKLKNIYPPFPAKDTPVKVQVHHDLEHMGCERLMTSP